MSFLNYIYYCLLSFCVVVPQVALSKGQLKTLNEETWSEMLTGEWMVEFYAPWCPACQHLQPLWKEFAAWSDDLSIKVADIDISSSPGLSGRFMITALPTIFHVKDGHFRQYRGSRDKESFISFVEERKWQDIDPVPSWKSPQSYQMSTLSSFFKLSMTVRGMHNDLIEKHGIPYWGSYMFFGLITIILGAILGLIIVFIIDFFCPTRTGSQNQSVPIDAVENDIQPEEEIRNENDGEYEGEDVIKDDTEDDDADVVEDVPEAAGDDGEVRRRNVPE